jgi:hypothetical protein
MGKGTKQMKHEIILSDKNWIALREQTTLNIRPFENTINLGTFDIQGIEHIENISVKLSNLEVKSKLVLRAKREMVEVLFGKTKLGILPLREGAIFSKLLIAGKKLTAKVAKKDFSKLLPSILVSISLEEF